MGAAGRAFGISLGFGFSLEPLREATKAMSSGRGGGAGGVLVGGTLGVGGSGGGGGFWRSKKAFRNLGPPRKSLRIQAKTPPERMKTAIIKRPNLHHWLLTQGLDRFLEKATSCRHFWLMCSSVSSQPHHENSSKGLAKSLETVVLNQKSKKNRGKRAENGPKSHFTATSNTVRPSSQLFPRLSHCCQSFACQREPTRGK